MSDLRAALVVTHLARSLADSATFLDRSDGNCQCEALANRCLARVDQQLGGTFSAQLAVA